MTDQPAPHACSNCEGIDPDTCLVNPDRHVCKPDASVYFCPTVGEIESDCHGGFDVCCGRPDLHRPPTEEQLAEEEAAARYARFFAAINAPLSDEAAEHIRRRLESGDVPRRKVRRREPAIKPDQPRITPNPEGGALLHLPDITYLDTQVWSVDIGLTADGLRELRAALASAPTADDTEQLRQRAEAAEAALARVRAIVADLRRENLRPKGILAAVFHAIDHPADQSPVRPAHDDGSPYRYQELVVEGWGHCDGCQTWIRGFTTPHPCTPDQPAASYAERATP